MNEKFWNFVKNEDTGETELYFEGPISDTTWFGDEITPGLFKSELSKHPGNLTVWLSSPGGDVFAASQIYTMLRNHKGKITVKIDSLAASAASVIAMAGDETFISPTGYIMIHNPAMLCAGNKADMQKAIELLDEIKEGIINAYMEKSMLSHDRIAKMMDDTTWMNAKKALKMGFVDGILFAKKDEPVEEPEEEENPDKDAEPEQDAPPDENTPDEDEPEKTANWSQTAMLYAQAATAQAFMQKISAMTPEKTVPIEQLKKRLALLKN